MIVYGTVLPYGNAGTNYAYRSGGQLHEGRKAWELHYESIAEHELELKSLAERFPDHILCLLKRVDPSDIIQEALMQANQKLDAYLRERPIPFYPWLRQLAWDQLVTAYRRHVVAHRRSANREDYVPDLSDESVAELATFLCDLSEEPLRKLLRAEAQGRLRAALSQLEEQDREILVLRYLEQLPTADTAAVLKLGLSAVKMRHLRAIERLRELLGNQPLEPSK